MVQRLLIARVLALFTTKIAQEKRRIVRKSIWTQSRTLDILAVIGMSQARDRTRRRSNLNRVCSAVGPFGLNEIQGDPPS